MSLRYDGGKPPYFIKNNKEIVDKPVENSSDSTEGESMLVKELFEYDFMSFLHQCFLTLNPGGNLHTNWHLEVMSEQIHRVNNGEVRRLMVNMPPRCLKSISFSVAFPAWILAYKPHSKIILATYSQVLSEKHFSDLKRILNSSWYKAVFPEVKIARSQINRVTTSQHGFVYSTSVGGTLTGEGGDFLIIDDPHNPTHINSSKMRKKVIDWYEQTFYSRLNNTNTGSIILVTQRLHTEDLSGHLLKQGNWSHILIPIVADKDYTYQNYPKDYTFNKGEILDKERFSPAAIEQLRINLGEHNFLAQYMQTPRPRRGLIASSYIGHITREQLDTSKFKMIVQSWDTAVKTSDQADYSACVTFGITDETFYVLNIKRGRVDYSDLKAQFISAAAEYRPDFILVEDKSSGQQLIQEANRSGVHNITAIKPRVDKITRVALSMEFWRKRMLVFVEPVCPDIISEILHFPYAKHDDVLDCITQFLDFMRNLKQRSSDYNGGGFEFV